MAEICDETADVQEEDITTPGCVQEDVKTTARKLVFTKNGDIKELSSKKSSGKVVYKRPKTEFYEKKTFCNFAFAGCFFVFFCSILIVFYIIISKNNVQIE